MLIEGIHMLTGDCKRVHDRHAAYRVVCLEGQLLGAGDGELPVVARTADKEARCSLGGVNILKKRCTMPVSELSSLPHAAAAATVVAAPMRKLWPVYWSWYRPMEFRIIRI